MALGLKTTALLNRLPKRMRLLLVLTVVHMLIFTLFRIVFWMTFRVEDDPLPGDILLKSFYLGIKFDLRLTLLLLLPIVFLSWIPGINIIRSKAGKPFWKSYLLVVVLGSILFYITDLAHFAYLERRVDATLLKYVENPWISFRMAWETYPVWGAVLSLMVFAVMYWLMTGKLVTHFTKQDRVPLERWKRILIMSLCTFLYMFGIYGKLSYYPLRWSEAFFDTHRFSSALALNPVLYFFDTLESRGKEYDEEEVRKYYDVISPYLGVKKHDPRGLNFSRTIHPTPLVSGNPNVILIVLESFAAHKIGIFGNPMESSPHFDKIAHDSLFFRRFYVPSAGTARAIFATLIGTPDVITHRTSSRNPTVVKQRTIVNSFRNYEKMYFIGGSANWGNIRGVLSHNIEGLRIYEEGDYDSPRMDVWGIADLHLFEEVNDVLRNENQPFFAIIHTAGNHRPYTIPEDNRGFQPISEEEERVKKYGFVSLAELNSFRFMDHSLGWFINTAKQEDYFENTIFLILADHGLVGRAPHMPKAEEEFGLTHFHVPFLIYSPSHIPKGKTFDGIASQIDVLPTLAGIMGRPFLNTTLGRNLFDSGFDSQRYAFILSQRKAVPEIGLLGEKFYLVMDSDGTNKRLSLYHSETPQINLMHRFPEETQKMERLCKGLYETSRYILHHNFQESHDAQSRRKESE